MKVSGLEIQIKEKTPNSIVIGLSFSTDYEFFKGHFDEFSILPALIQIKLVVDFANEHFPIDFMPKAMPSMKFLKPICPGYRLDLFIIHNQEKNRIEFEYREDDALYSKGTLKI
jgi:3-hydroxyacyl-[acyl-carrier-protein] dehydratase